MDELAIVVQAAFQPPMGCKRLVKLRGVRVQDAQFHRGMTGFEQKFTWLHGAVMNMLEVDTMKGSALERG